ncbi:MAG TPA: chromosome segregation protein SMC [Aestuariivirgaceae bacterium]|jgi:chromosome segregation protein
MKFTRLRLSGFKSFVEPTELLIEPGLTGIVGPNGCGKSNLLEALRWVMGENSTKNMRAADMDDVIFSGTAARPARNMAEVMVTLDNGSRKAPPQFNELEAIEIARRIEREAGSAYRINGRDVRARDVQLLFADVSTGARSPALVRQGQIGELISAKPQARRRVLEEAAGIAGLHTRRHEAELKLKAAESNLQRLDDVVAQLESQLGGLKRQARQAKKYKQLSAEIRRLEAASLYLAWAEAEETAKREQAALEEITRQLAEHTRALSEATRQRDSISEGLPRLREAEAGRAAALQRLNLERQALDEEEARTKARRSDLQARLAQAERDLEREGEAMRDTTDVLARLNEEEELIKSVQRDEAHAREEAAIALQEAAQGLAQAQERADASNARLMELAARRNSLARIIDDQRARLSKLERDIADVSSRRRSFAANAGAQDQIYRLSQAVESALATALQCEQNASAAEIEVRQAREEEAQARRSYDEARRASERVETEVLTLSKLLRGNHGQQWPPLIDALSVKPGYEAALGAALGDELEASAEETAPVHWRSLPPLSDAALLPAGAEPLSKFVAAPPALARRLTHVGVVDRQMGRALQNQLLRGQRLVSREGDLWRWDGFSAAAEAPTAAARRLAERNRLASLEIGAAAARSRADAVKRDFDAAQQTVELATSRERMQHESWRAATAAVDAARRALGQQERQMTDRLQQISALDEAGRRLDEGLSEARERLQQAETELSLMPGTDALQQEVNHLREALNRQRTLYGEARARHDGLEREVKSRAERLEGIERDRREWTDRLKRAEGQIDELKERASAAREALEELAFLPVQIEDKRKKLLSALQEAESLRNLAADALAQAESVLKEAEGRQRGLQDQLSASREEHGRSGAMVEAARARHRDYERRIADVLGCKPGDVAQTAGFELESLPQQEEIEGTLAGLREDRERLGGVNLRAEEEAQAVQAQLDGLVKEKDDLLQAIAKLRAGIQSLNREGRQRLLEAFDTVNQNFGTLFTTLFAGGKAELQLVESDDPLEAGLEILAHPPGKKPQVLSLLSGGEQALTAMALIFAVFLTNPSPICVLDEVDAPLDDHNVERFCNLLDAMLERTDTRFLIITHHALTMARMHRLFGVTMMERGISQLVSVDLETAEGLREAS